MNSEERTVDIVEKATTHENDREPMDDREMSFLDHLEELRWRLIKALLGVVIGTVLCFAFIDWLMTNVLIKPAADAGINLQNLKPFGQVLLYMEVAFAGGILISFPNVMSSSIVFR